MGQEVGPPIDHFRTQAAPKTDETLRTVFNTLIQAYDTVRQGRITDSKTIRLIARQFETIADSPEASDLFPYDAGRVAAALYNWALDLDMRTRDRASGRVVHTAHDSDLVEAVSETPQTTTEVNNLTKNTTEKIKPFKRPTHVVDNTQDLAQADTMEREVQKRIQKDRREPIIPEQRPEGQPEMTGISGEQAKITPEIEIAEDAVPHTVWQIMAEWRKEAEQLDLKAKRANAFNANLSRDIEGEGKA